MVGKRTKKRYIFGSRSYVCTTDGAPPVDFLHLLREHRTSGVSMASKRRSTSWTALLAILAWKNASVTGFHAAAPSGGVRQGRFSDVAAAPVQALRATSSTADFGGMLGDKVASAIVGSPVYPLLIKQAKTTMKKSAEVPYVHTQQ